MSQKLFLIPALAQIATAVTMERSKVVGDSEAKASPLARNCLQPRKCPQDTYLDSPLARYCLQPRRPGEPAKKAMTQLTEIAGTEQYDTYLESDLGNCLQPRRPAAKKAMTQLTEIAGTEQYDTYLESDLGNCLQPRRPGEPAKKAMTQLTEIAGTEQYEPQHDSSDDSSDGAVKQVLRESQAQNYAVYSDDDKHFGHLELRGEDENSGNLFKMDRQDPQESTRATAYFGNKN